MSDTSTTHPDPLEVIVTALTDGGPRTAGQLAEHLGIPYPTLTPRLRVLESDGRAQRVKDPRTRVTVWHATTDTPPTTGTTPDDSPTPPVTAPVLDPVPTDPGETNLDASPSTPPTTTATDTTAEGVTSARRPKGSIPAAILEVARAHPDTTFKVSQLQKALGGISAGAIANAATKLVVAGELLLVCEKPVTVQAA